MLEKYLNQVNFSSTEDFKNNYHVNVPENFNFGYDIVDEWARVEPNKQALCWVNNKGVHRDFTFGQMKEESDKTASYLQSMGIGRGDMVMLVMKRRFEFWFVMVALHKLGAIAIPATHMLMESDISYRNNAAGVKMIISTDDDYVVEHINAAMKDSPTVEHLVCCGDNVPEGWRDYRKEYPQAAPFVRPDFVNHNDDLSLLYFTSGTTGEPKMVTHDYTYPLGHIVTAKYWHNLDESSLHLTLADTGWGKAVWGKLYGQWIVGANVFVYDHDIFNPESILQLIETYKITSFCAPPTVYSILIREDFKKHDLSSLKYCTTAGEALNPTVYNTFLEYTGIKIHEAFGQTETTATIITFPWLEPKSGSMGVANPAYDIDLVDENDNSVAPGEEGEIIIRTDKFRPLGLFQGYYKDPDLTQSVYHNHIYHTGDLATRDEDGYFRFIGRNDDVIKSAGYRIGPFEVESALMSHPYIMECAVTGAYDEMRGQVIKATVVLAKEHRHEAGDKLARDIKKHVKSVTASYKTPRIIEFVDELPKTISGKIKRAQIRNQDN